MRKIFILLFTVSPYLCSGQIITTVAGTGVAGYNGDGIAATAAKLFHAGSMIFDSAGNLFIGDNYNQRIRIVNAAGIINTYVGTGVAGYSGDGGLADTAKIGYQIDVLFDIYGNLIFSDANNNRIRKVNVTTGIITTIAGTGVAGYSGDSGLATAAELDEPGPLAIDKAGNIYFADVTNRRVRKIDIGGIITTYAGTGIPGFNGDGGLADTAKLSTSVLGLACDAGGNLYIADRGNARIRKVDAMTHIINTIAGNGSFIYIASGIPAITEGICPGGLTTDAYDNLFIADFGNNRILKMDTTGTIYSIAGNEIGGYSEDGGLADTTELFQPFGVAFDVCGNLYIADMSNNRIRKITYPPTLTIPTISLSGAGSVPAGSTVTVNATVTNAGSSYLIYWMNHGIEFTTTTMPTVTYIKTAGIDTITAKVVPTGYGCWDSTTSGGLIINTSSEASPLPSPGERVTVYPNPVHDVVHVDNVATPASYKIVNIVGSVMQLGTLQRSNQLFIKELPEGVYVLEVMDGEGGRTVRKIVKE